MYLDELNGPKPLQFLQILSDYRQKNAGFHPSHQFSPPATASVSPVT